MQCNSCDTAISVALRYAILHPISYNQHRSSGRVKKGDAMQPIKIVVRFLDGRTLKGQTHDFNPDRPSFHFHTDKGQPVMQLDIKDIKALFFVKDYDGNKEYYERKEFNPGDIAQGRKVEITFIDGEAMQGSTTGYDPKRQGFFLIPTDPKGNNTRIFVVKAAIKDFRFL